MVNLRSPIAVTGLGAVHALGGDVAALLDGIRAGRSGLDDLSRFDPMDGPPRPVGEVTAVPGHRRQGTVTHRLAIAAALEAAQVAAARCDADRIAVVCGTWTGGIANSEVWFLNRLAFNDPSPTLLEHHPAASVTAGVAQALGAGGPRLTVSESSSAIALGADLLRAGEADLVFAGGADALTLLTYFGLSSLGRLDDTPCRPFGADRSGLNLGEAGAFLALERGDDAASRGAAVHGWLSGSACAVGTGPQPCLLRALSDAGLGPDAIDYVNANGSATLEQDATEALALRAVFGAPPPVSSSKSFLGHTLGAAGAIEAVVTVLAIRHGLLPPTLNTREPDPAAPDDLVPEPREAAIAHALSTSVASGGRCTGLVFSRERPA